MNAYILETLKNNLPASLFTTPSNTTNELAITTHLVGLSLFQMPLIYHHIAVGAELKLCYNYGASKAQQAVEVFYKNYKLGHLPAETAELVEKVLMHGFDVKVKVEAIIKEKYLPTSGLKISITDNQL